MHPAANIKRLLVILISKIIQIRTKYKAEPQTKPDKQNTAFFQR